MPARTIVHVVPHTHWDREWYEPFEVYRFQLLKALDRLVEVLDATAGFRHFHMDGQTAAVEDYLEVRPEREQALARLVHEGRLSVGPWRILMDEFLCSPETIVRNLQQGRRLARALGGDPRVGYIPDSFGHIAQMPQILRLAGMTDAAVWRGVPSAVDRTAFEWAAPDGTAIRTLYLATSYSNGATLPDTFEELMVRAKRILEYLEPFRPPDALLAMNGSDHQGPQAHLPALFAEANGRQEEFEFRLGSVAEYLPHVPGEGLPRWRGELRSGARANLLMGVASARVGLKQREFRASTLLERYAEPLAALAGTDVGLTLERCWRWMVENSAHDSICGCGVDEVADDVAARYEDAARVADLVATDAMLALAQRIDLPGLGGAREGALLFNPSPWPRSEVVEVTLPTDRVERMVARAPDGGTHPVQVLSGDEEVVIDMTVTGQQLAQIVAPMHSRKIGALFINEASVEPGRTTRIRLRLGPVEEEGFDQESTYREVVELARARPRGRFQVLGVGPSVCRVLVRTPEIGALGWTVLGPAAGDAAPPRQPARVEAGALDNGILRASVRPDGSVDLLHHATGTQIDGALAREDGGDAGDEYNYSPPERDLVIVTPAGEASVEAIEEGPLRAALRVRAEWRIPAGLDAAERGRLRKTVAMPVQMDLSLRAGEPFLRATILLDNRATDHRVRAVVSLPFEAERSHADTAFHVTERGPLAEGGPHEYGLPTFPSRRWVDVSDGRLGVAVLHRGTPEYELVEGRRLAITLLRGVGWLSRQDMRYRAGPAGPSIPTPGAQALGPHRFRLAIYPHEGDWRAGAVHRVVESFAYPLRALPIRPHPGELPASGEALRIEPASVQLSALAREAGSIVCRVYNASPEPAEATLRPSGPLIARAAAAVDLFGEELARLPVVDGVIALPLRAWEIATVRLQA